MTQATRNRPISPHLSIYRPIPTMVASILHRITGMALYAGTLLVAWWLVAAGSGAEQFDRASGVFGSIFGQIILFGYTWALAQHLLGGIRHLIWDTGRGLEKDTSRNLALATLIGSVILTILIWVAVYAAGY